MDFFPSPKTYIMKNILVSIDFEKQAGLLVDRAIELAKKFGAKLWLIHIAAPDPDFVGYDVGPQNVRDVRANELKEERNMLESYVRQLREDGIEVDAKLIEGPTVITITRMIRKLNIDLLIIGHHKRNYFYKAFVGNTDIALINQLSIPVLTVPLTNGYAIDPFLETEPGERVKREPATVRSEA
jgi:nucleotide-binding universal stress UspA family protein